MHDHREKKWGQHHEYASHHGPAHYVSEQSYRECEGACDFAQYIERQHEWGGLQIPFQVVAQSMFTNAVVGDGQEYYERQCSGGGQ